MINTDGRHPATRHLARWLTPNPHLPAGPPSEVSAACEWLASAMIRDLPDGPELSAGLRHLLEAKDALVRAAVDAVEEAGDGR